MSFYTYNLYNFLKKHHNRCTLIPSHQLKVPLSSGTEIMLAVPVLNIETCHARLLCRYKISDGTQLLSASKQAYK
jgi:hypothetical protein